LPLVLELAVGTECTAKSMRAHGAAGEFTFLD
jgi:hypothetical protein